jgi:hypothetical protein
VEPAVRGDHRAAHEDLTVIRDVELDARQPPRRASADVARRDLRCRLGHAVRRHHGQPDGDRPIEELVGDRAAAEQERAQAVSALESGITEAGEHRRHERDDRHLTALEQILHSLGVELLLHDRRRAVERRAYEDRQAADVEDRKAAQPPVVGGDPEMRG